MSTNVVARRLLVCAALAVAAVAGGACTDDSDGPADAPITDAIDRRPWNTEDHDRLEAIEVTGYVTGQTIDAGDALVRTFTSDANPDGVTLVVRARFAPCSPGTCWDPTEDLDDTRVEQIRQVLPTDHMDNPDLVFEYGPDELAPDFQGFDVYYRSMLEGGGTAIGYQFRYHDDVNLVEMMVYPQGAPTPITPDDLEAQMPRPWANEVAADVFAAFADEFNATAT